ncbi:hypothetical protein JW930_01445 [Candidatus Woesearchaeota archaeon]|nr:hypothetical protein [Candidatus Woesearchaeota archaeon]
MNNLFEILDKSGRKIRLSKERWNHICREHPYISNLEELKLTMVNPLLIKPSRYDPEQVRWYYRYNKGKKLYLFVAVKYLNGDGFIITAYYVKNIK